MTRIARGFAALAIDQRAATAIEYGLIAALIAVGAVGAITGFGDGLGNMWNYVTNEVLENS